MYLLYKADRSPLDPTQPPVQRIPETLILEGKPPGREAKHTPPYTAEVMNERSCNSTARMPSWRAHYNFTLLHVLFDQSLTF